MDGRSRSQVAESLLEHSYERRLSSEQNGEEKNGDGGVHGLKQRSDRINFAKGDYSDSSTSNGSTNGHAKKADFRTYSTHDQEVLRLLGQYLQNLGLTYASTLFRPVVLCCMHVSFRLAGKLYKPWCLNRDARWNNTARPR